MSDESCMVQSPMTSSILRNRTVALKKIPCCDESCNHWWHHQWCHSTKQIWTFQKEWQLHSRKFYVVMSHAWCNHTVTGLDISWKSAGASRNFLACHAWCNGTATGQFPLNSMPVWVLIWEWQVFSSKYSRHWAVRESSTLWSLWGYQAT